MENQEKTVLKALFVRAQMVLSPRMRIIKISSSFLAFASDGFFNDESMHFADTVKFVDQTSHSDAISQSDAKLWAGGIWQRNELSCFVQYLLFSRLAIYHILPMILFAQQWCTSIWLIKCNILWLASSICAFVKTGKRKVLSSSSTLPIAQDIQHRFWHS